MKKITVFTIAFAASLMALTSCNNAPKADASAGTSSGENTKTCFLLVEFKVDTTRVSLTLNGTEAKGDMACLPYEKDAAIGTFKGTRSGDTLKTVYDYTIEGNVQQEQVWFLLKDNALSKGEGELEENKTGTLMYKDTKKIKFGAPFTKVDCK